jgi:Prenyltransferase and squalene oxidase repeat
VAGRVALAPIPNVVATTDVVIFSGYALGGAPGFAVGALAGLISNFWLGQGPWTPWQMAGWGLCGVLGALLARVRGPRVGRIELALVCGIAGVAYGALLNFSLMVSYGGELTLERFGVLQARAVPFDVAHAAGNVTLALIAGPAMIRMLARFRERFQFRWRDTGLGATSAAAVVLLLSVVLGGAIHSGGAHAAPGVPAVGWLQRSQNGDGGFPDTPGEDSSPEMTAWAMLGLEASGVNPRDVHSRGKSAIDYLRRNLGELRTPGDLARTALALEGAGVGAHGLGGRDLLARLRARQRRNGSFQGWPNSTAFAVLALRGTRFAGRGRAKRWLRQVQNGDGGWGAVPASASDPDSTGAVLQALGGGSRSSRRAVRYLRRTQVRGGGWALGATGAVNSQSTAWAIQGLLAAGVDPGSVRRRGRSGLDYLAARIAGNGHYRYSRSSDQTPVWVTGQVLVAANLRSYPLAAVARSGEGATPAASREGSPNPSLTRHSREEPPVETPGRPPREDAKRSGGASAPPADTSSAANPPPGAGAAGTGDPSSPRSMSTDAGGGGGDGDSPLGPVALGLLAGGLVLGGGWLAARRLLW